MNAIIIDQLTRNNKAGEPYVVRLVKVGEKYYECEFAKPEELTVPIKVRLLSLLADEEMDPRFEEAVQHAEKHGRWEAP
ncbi:MAG: hypothetical protein V4481_00960 [Patescibacteria group bacterium]